MEEDGMEEGNVEGDEEMRKELREVEKRQDATSSGTRIFLKLTSLSVLSIPSLNTTRLGLRLYDLVQITGGADDRIHMRL